MVTYKTFSCTFAAYFQNTFSQEYLWVAASDICKLKSWIVQAANIKNVQNFKLIVEEAA